MVLVAVVAVAAVSVAACKEVVGRVGTALPPPPRPREVLTRPEPRLVRGKR